MSKGFCYKHVLAGVAIATPLLAAVTAAAAPPMLRDRFIDGSGRHAPTVVIVPRLQGDVGAYSDDPGFDISELRHRVSLGPYALGRTEVTNAEFAMFLNETGNKTDSGIAWFDPKASRQIVATKKGYVAMPDTANRPAAGMTWMAARAYAHWLSKKTGAAYDLPTGAQWEMAARAGTETAWWWGSADDPSRYRSIAAEERVTADVTAYAPNPWGFYGMAGNVWEWMLDCYAGDAPLLAASRDPRILNDQCDIPEIRGGSFRDGGQYSRPSYRSNTWWSSKVDVLGFRVARRIDPPRAVAGARTLRLAWQRLGHPAEVLAILTAAGKPPVAMVSNGGTLDLPRSGGAMLKLFDPVSGLLLFDGTAPTAQMALPEPLRVRGRIRGAADGAVARVRIGSGPRAAPMERWLRATGSQAPRDGRMSSSLGVAMPLSPLAWTEARISGRTFDSGWVLGTDPPQLVAFDGSGKVAVSDIVIPDAIEPYAELDVGEIVLQSSASVDIQAALPKSPLPVPLLIGVKEVVIDASAKAEAGLLLSALDQIDPRLFDLLVLDHGLTLSYDGAAQLRPLPRFSSMTLLVHEPVGGKVSEHQVLLAFGNAATVHLGPLKDGVFRTEPAIAFSGRLTVEGSGSPVPNAGIVVSDYPWQYETKTDATGRFSLSGVRGGGTVAIFVDASLSGVGASAVKTHVFRDMAASDLVELVLPSVQAPPDPKMIAAIPEPPPSVGDGCTPHNDPQYGVVTSRLFWDEKNVEVDPASYSVIATKPNPPVITLTACVDPSKWTVWSAYSAFDVNTGQATDKKAPPSPDFCPAACKGSKACMQYKVALKPLQPNLARVAIEFKNPKGYSVGKGIEITFSPPGPYALDYDPTPLLTDQEGKIILCDVSVNPVRVFYQGPQGHTDCDVTLGKQGTVVLDGKCIAAASPENQGATR